MPKDEEEVSFIVEASLDMTSFLVSIVSPSKMSEGEVAACLRTLADDIDEREDSFFSASNPINNELQ